MRVSVIVVNWNGCHLLDECLAALRAQTYPPFEVIVVDNGSVDGSSRWLKDYVWDRLRCVFLPENRGFAGGNNVAIDLARGDLIGLINNDAIADPNWIGAAVSAIDRSDVGMVACRALRADNSNTIDKAGHLMFADGLNRGKGTGHLDGASFDGVQDALWPDGCAGFYRRDMIGEIGAFDPDFFLYGEDAELGMRARWAGYRCLYVGDSIVHHKHSASLGKYSPRKVFFVERNRIWLLVKTFPLSWVLISPLHSVSRHLMNVVSMLRGRGSAHGFRDQHSIWTLVGVFFRAHLSACLGIPKMLVKRAGVKRVVKGRAMKALLREFRLSARQIALED